MSDPTPWLTVALPTAIHGLVFLGICLHCLREQREPSATVFWLAITFAFPAFGAILYLTLGIDRMPDRSLRRVAADEKLMNARTALVEDAAALRGWFHGRSNGTQPGPDSHLEQHLNLALDRLLPDHPLLGGNTITPLIDGDEAFPAMLQAIKAATHHIHVQSFIIGRDATGRQFMEALATKAREGVRVRILYDRLGSGYSHWLGFFRPYRNIPNMSLSAWTLYDPLRGSFTINLRNHRKVLIVDGQSGFIGGVNLHDGNCHATSANPIRDYHFSVTGPIVHDLQYTFMRDWYCMTDEAPEALLAHDYFPHLPMDGPCLGRLINSGPSSEMEVHTDVLFSAVINAQKQILIATPYFVPSNELLRALRSVSLRGVDVRIVVPKNNNHATAASASRGLYASLLASGVRVFERRGSFMHAKAFLVDDRFAIIGTPNWDLRSLRLSYESALAIQNDAFANDLKHIVLDEMSQSDEIELNSWQQRPARQKMVENLWLLMRPVL